MIYDPERALPKGVTLDEIRSLFATMTDCAKAWNEDRAGDWFDERAARATEILKAWGIDRDGE